MDHAALDHPIWQAMNGPQWRFVIGGGPARRFQPEIAPFADVDELSADNLAALANMLRPGEQMALFTLAPVTPPAGLDLLRAIKLSQMVAESPGVAGDEIDMVRLAPSDVPAMLELVALTQPGPFGPRTIELGQYLGIKADGRLVAMAGERLKPLGYAEVSAVCTHPDYRGRGYGRAVVSRVARAIAARGETPFLHVLPDNAAAIATYTALGFAERRLIDLTVLRKPASA